MAQYKVVNQDVEIGGILRRVGEELDESCFNPAPEVTPEQRKDGIESHLSEAESLLASGHVEEI